MSAWLRQRRAQQTLEREYVAQRENVLRAVRSKLNRDGIHLDDADLDAFYNQAWHGVYGQLLEGARIANPPGLLVRVTYCRAVDEYRKLHVTRRADHEEVADRGIDPDAAQQVDDEAKLQQFVEGLKDRLSPRECEAATLCYLLGFSRPEAAERLGVEPRRMEKIMDAVSKKVGEFVRDIEAGEWCERRGSLMRAYALGVLDPDGERYVLAREHLDACSSCRAYVRNLRGLGAVLPPVGLPLGGDGLGLLEPLARLLDGLRDLAGAATASPATAKIATGLVLVAAGGGAVVAAAPPAATTPRAATPIGTPTSAPAFLPRTLSATPPRATAEPPRERRGRAKTKPRARTKPTTPRRRVVARQRPVATRTAVPTAVPSAAPIPAATVVAAAPKPAPTALAERRPAAPVNGEFTFERASSP